MLELRREIQNLEPMSRSAVVRRAFRFVLQELAAGRISVKDLESVVWDDEEELPEAPPLASKRKGEHPRHRSSR